MIVFRCFFGLEMSVGKYWNNCEGKLMSKQPLSPKFREKLVLLKNFMASRNFFKCIFIHADASV